MGGIYYNEWDEPTARWLRELGAGHHLPSGHIDTRSIRDVQPDDVSGYDQCHFFAGIGGWPLALRWAGLENVPGIWTGSPPCQPFSVAGKGLAQSDERHLAPVWLDLVRECKPVLLLGEQVADAIGKGWLDDLFDALEREGYACGAAVLPACSVGAPHIRKRLFFGAVRLADSARIGREQICTFSGRGDERDRTGRRSAGLALRSSDFGMANAINHGCGEHGRCLDRAPQAGSGEIGEREWLRPNPSHGGSSHGMADTASIGRDRGRSSQESDEPGSIERSDGFRDVGGLAHASSAGRGQTGCNASRDREADEGRARDRDCDGSSDDLNLRLVRAYGTNPHNGFWSGADWLGCRDGKFRPVEPGTQPLVDGLPKGMVRGSVRSLAEYPGAARVMRLRGYGNAIVPEVATTFITEFLGAFADVTKNH